MMLIFERKGGEKSTELSTEGVEEDTLVSIEFQKNLRPEECVF